MTASERHNRLAAEITKKIVKEGGSIEDALVVLESVVLGVVMFAGGNPRDGGVYLDAMSGRVTERLTTWKGPTR